MPEYYTPKGDKSPEELMQYLFSLKQKYAIGHYAYSCINLITTMRVIETVIHEPMWKFYAKNFTGPLGLTRTMFVPPDSLKQFCLPTTPRLENQGMVHDPLAAGLKGLSGNAGLFSTTGDLAVFCQFMLNYGTVKGIHIVDSTTVAEFIRCQTDSSSGRGLGWGTNAVRHSSAGKKFSRESFGHTGYTGTSVWCDPTRKIFVVLLTNRVYPNDKADVGRTRVAVADAVINALDATCSVGGSGGE
jgi:CubicO group peptidase (beta-lactamase class C family)